MKYITKLSVITILIAALMLGLASCTQPQRDGEPHFAAYSFSDVVMTQTGVNSYQFEFTVDCGSDDVKIYLTERDRIKSTDIAKTVEKSVSDGYARFIFEEALQLSEEYYLWVIGDGKEAMLPITAPSMFPSLSERIEGGALFNFNYTFGVSWSSFCDPNGKAVYESDSAVFDESAEVIQDKIAITEEGCIIPADRFDPGKYYYSVTTAKNGLLKIISSPVMLSNGISGQISGISAKITNDLHLQVDVAIVPGSDMEIAGAEHLELVVKSGAGDEIYSSRCVFNNGVATMSFDCELLITGGLWYDLCLTWRGAIFMDVPKTLAGEQVDTVSTVKQNGIAYNLIGWKPEDADESATMLKLYFEVDATRYAEEFCKTYLVTFTLEPEPAIVVTVKLKDNVYIPPQLAITGGDIVKIASVDGVRNDDGTYTFAVPVEDAFTETDKWYDIRLFFENTPCELLKDSCISYKDFAKKYTDDSAMRVYEFREYNGMLKMMYTEIT